MAYGTYLHTQTALLAVTFVLGGVAGGFPSGAGGHRGVNVVDEASGRVMS